MYRVYINDQTTAYPLYEPLDETLRIFKPELTQEIGKAGNFKFFILASHPYASKIGLLKTEVIVYDDDEAIFNGRVLKPEYDIENLISVTCEGEYTYFIDSQQRPYEFTGTISEFIEQVLTVHNSQVDNFKKIYKGNIIVADENNEITRSDTDYTNTQDTLENQLVSTHGGYMRVRHTGGVKYLDYLWDYGGINDQVIRFGENLLELNRYMDATNIITCLIPLGATVEYTDNLGEKQVRTVDITSVNQGFDYIKNDAAIEKYGKVWGKYKWDDITDPEELLAKAETYLSEVSALPTGMEINALDLSLIDTSVQRFQLGYWTTVSSVPHGIEQKLMLKKRVINLLDPTAGSITLGKTSATFTESVTQKQMEAVQAIKKVEENASSEINRKVENATALITGGLGGYVVLDNVDPNTGEIIHPWRILIMNTPDKDTAKNVIQFNQNGIGFSTTGINGPYRNAWTIDGNLVADFITTGSMLADRIRGGTLEIGGTSLGKDGSIIVKDASGNTIGSWDKTGLSILKGILQGVSAIFGGLNNESGAIEVRNAGGRTIGRWDKDGLYITSGDLSVGPFEANQDEVIFGDFSVSADETYVFRSNNGSIIFQSEGNGPLGALPTLAIGDTTINEQSVTTERLMAEEIMGTAVLRNSTSGSGGKFSGMSIYEALRYLDGRISDSD